MDVRTRVTTCRLLEKMKKNPPVAAKLGLVDVSRKSAEASITEQVRVLKNMGRIVRRKDDVA